MDKKKVQSGSLLSKRPTIKATESIQTHFYLNIIVWVGILLTIQAILMAYQVSESMEALVKETLKARAGEITSHLDKRLLQIRQKTSGLALAVSNMPDYDTAVMYHMADAHIQSDSLVIGSGFWFEPNAYEPGREYFGPYRRRTGDGSIELTMIYSNAAYDYPSTDWYRNAMVRPGNVAWTGPYLDDVTGITMLTTACAIRKQESSLGCVTIDIGLMELEDYIRDLHIGTSGYAVLLTQEGYYLGSRDENVNMVKKITEDKDPHLASLGQRLIEARGDTALFDAEIRGTECYVIASPLCIENMKLVLVAPKSDYSASIQRFILLSTIMMGLIMLFLCLAIHAAFKNRIALPIRRLAAHAEKIAEGEKAADLPVASHDEIGNLAYSLQQMEQNLRQRSDLLEEQYRLLSLKNQELKTALQNVENMRLSRDSYKAESETDRLTGLFNKAAIEHHAAEALACRQEDRICALYILDLDHFKEANDTYGHQYGDLILRAFSGTLKSFFRPTDIIGRFGGDEFIVLLTDLPGRKIAEENAQQILRAATGLKAAGRLAGISTSIGIALAPIHGTTYKDLFAAADQCLYKAKQQGRNGYCIGMEETVH